MLCHTPRHVVEAALETDLAGPQLAHAGQILNPLCDLIPGRVVLVGGSIARGLDRVVLQHQRVQRDDLRMAVEDIDGQLSRDVGGERGYLGIDLLLAQHGDGRESRCRYSVRERRSCKSRYAQAKLKSVSAPGVGVNAAKRGRVCQLRPASRAD